MQHFGRQVPVLVLDLLEEWDKVISPDGLESLEDPVHGQTASSRHLLSGRDPHRDLLNACQRVRISAQHQGSHPAHPNHIGNDAHTRAGELRTPELAHSGIHPQP
jgi:hypothetical protein